MLFLGASVSQVEAIRRAREVGHRVVAIDADPAAVGFADADVAETIDFSIVEDVTSLARRHRVVNAELYMRPRETINPVQVAADRRGYVIATASAAQVALGLADDTALALEVEVEAKQIDAERRLDHGQRPVPSAG